MIGYDRRVWREHDANGASMSDLSYQTTWDTTRKQPGARGVLTNFTGGRHGVELGQGTPRHAGRARHRRSRAGVPRACRGRAPVPRETRFHWPTHPWSLGSYACLRPGDWTGSAARWANPSAACISPASTARWIPRASWKAAASRARPRRARCWRSAASCTGDDFPPIQRAAEPGAHRLSAFLNQPVLFCSAACIPDNDSFTIGTHPDVGEGAGPYPVRRCGLFICRCESCEADGTHARIVAMTDAADAHASRQLARLCRNATAGVAGGSTRRFAASCNGSRCQ